MKRVVSGSANHHWSIVLDPAKRVTALDGASDIINQVKKILSDSQNTLSFKEPYEEMVDWAGGIAVASFEQVNLRDYHWTAQRLQSIWKNLLTLKSVNLDDDFVYLGGDSRRLRIWRPTPLRSVRGDLK